LRAPVTVVDEATLRRCLCNRLEEPLSLKHLLPRLLIHAGQSLKGFEIINRWDDAAQIILAEYPMNVRINYHMFAKKDVAFNIGKERFLCFYKEEDRGLGQQAWAEFEKYPAAIRLPELYGMA